MTAFTRLALFSWVRRAAVGARGEVPRLLPTLLQPLVCSLSLLVRGQRTILASSWTKSSWGHRAGQGTAGQGRQGEQNSPQKQVKRVWIQCAQAGGWAGVGATCVRAKISFKAKPCAQSTMLQHPRFLRSCFSVKLQGFAPTYQCLIHLALSTERPRQPADEAVCQVVDDAPHVQLLALSPRTLHHRAGAHMEHLAGIGEPEQGR